MASLRTLLFLVGTALVSGGKLKINPIQYPAYSPYEIYHLPAEFADKKSLGNTFGIPNLASLIPLPIQGIPGYLPILSRGERVDCDQSGYIISEQPALFNPIPEAPKISPILPEFKEKAETLGHIPEAPVLPPLVLPELSLKVEEPKQTFLQYPAGEYIETPETPKVGEKPLSPISEAPILPPFGFPDLPLKVSEEEPAPVFIPIKADDYYINTPEASKIEKAKPLGPIPEAPILPPYFAPIYVTEPEPVKLKEVKPLAPMGEAPVLPPFSLPKLPIKIAYESAPIYEPCLLPEAFIIEGEKSSKLNFGEIKPLAPVPEAPVLGLYPFSELPLKVSAPELAPAFIPISSEEYFTHKASKFEEKKPLAPIPEAPVLPPFNRPELIYDIQPETNKFEEVQFLAPIPEAPVLPPIALPEPVVVAVPETDTFEEIKPLAPIPEAPVPPSLTITDAGHDIDVPKFIEEIKPLVPIPEAPVLRPYTLPELPLKVSEKDVVECLPEELVVESPKEPEYVENNKLSIPEPPVLPPLVLPDIPTKVYEEPAPIFDLPELPAPIENNEIFEAQKIEELKPIPAAPELPPLKLPAFPQTQVITEAPELKPIPEAPELPPLAYNYKISPISTPFVTKIVEEPAKVFPGRFEYTKLSSPEFCVRTILNERVMENFVDKGNINLVRPFMGNHPGFVMYIPAATNRLPVYSS